MSEQKGQVEMDEWSKKIAEGLGVAAIGGERMSDEELKRRTEEEERERAEHKAANPEPSLVEKIKTSDSLVAQKVTFSGGQVMPGADLAPALNTTHVPADSNYLNDPVMYEHAMRVANAFSKSKILPELYQNDVASCFVALHMADRMQIDPFTFMQNSYVVKGKPAIEGKLMIAVLNARGGYIDGIEYEYSGKGDDYGCRAYGTLRNGKVHEARVDMKLVKAEGWYEKNSKWKNMPDQMLAYRSAAFLLRKYRPELLMGLQTYEEVQDVGGVVVQSPVGKYRRSDLNDSLDQG